MDHICMDFDVGSSTVDPGILECWGPRLNPFLFRAQTDAVTDTTERPSHSSGGRLLRIGVSRSAVRRAAMQVRGT